MCAQCTHMCQILIIHWFRGSVCYVKNHWTCSHSHRASPPHSQQFLWKKMLDDWFRKLHPCFKIKQINSLRFNSKPSAMIAPALATAWGFKGSPLTRLVSVRRSAPGNHLVTHFSVFGNIFKMDISTSSITRSLIYCAHNRRPCVTFGEDHPWEAVAADLRIPSKARLLYSLRRNFSDI